MKVGDYVHNAPYAKYGVIIDELVPITDERGGVVERRFMVLYDDATGMHLTGDTFLQKVENSEFAPETNGWTYRQVAI